jgi:hypothetical protein
MGQMLTTDGKIRGQDDRHLFATMAFGLSLNEACARWRWLQSSASRTRSTLAQILGAKTFLEALVRVLNERRINISELGVFYEGTTLITWWSLLDALRHKPLSPAQICFMIEEMKRYPRGLNNLDRRWGADSELAPAIEIMAQTGMEPQGSRTYISI